MSLIPIYTASNTQVYGSVVNTSTAPSIFSGNVGIGTTIPITSLNISAVMRNTQVLSIYGYTNVWKSNSSYSTLFSKYGIDTPIYFQYQSTYFYVVFNASENNQIRNSTFYKYTNNTWTQITSDVGLAPLTYSSVNSSSGVNTVIEVEDIDGLLITNKTDNSIFIINKNGNVGIGTTTPAAKLSVVGDTIVSGTVSSGTGLMFRNRIINGDMRINQRGTSTNLASMTAIAVGITNYYVVDRWNTYRGGLIAGGTMAQGTTSTTDLPFTDAGIRYFARVGRASGNTDTSQGVFTTYNFESQDSIPLAGKTVTLSFYYRTGANYTGTSITSTVVYGTGTDQALRNGYTGSTTICVNNDAPSTSWVRKSYTASVSTSATQIGIVFSYAPTGTAGANDWFDITGVQLELGSIATPFEYRPFATELALCQRYYQKSYNIGVAPGTAYTPEASGDTSVIARYPNQGGGRMTACVTFPVVMRATPAYAIYDSTGTASRLSVNANGSWVAAAQTIDASYASTSKIFAGRVYSTTGSGISYQYVVDAEL